MRRQQSIFGALTAFFAVVAGSLTLRSTSLYGVGLSPDSIGYLDLAKHISASGLSFLSEYQAITQPPGFPALLAFLSAATGTTLLQAARVLNVAISVALVVSIQLGVARVTTSIPVIIVSAIMASFSIPLSVVLPMAWTEPLFMLLISILFLIITGSRTTMPIAFLAGGISAAACLTRYAGIVVIPLAAASLFLVRPARLAERLKHLAAYALPCTLFALYLARNRAISGTFFGPRAPSTMGLGANVDLATRTILSWFLPERILSSRALLPGLLVLLGVVIWSNRRGFARVIRTSDRLAVLCTAFIFIYTAFMVWTSTTTAFDHIDSRLLAPVYPSLLVVVALCLKPEVWGGRIRSLAALGGFSLLLLAYPLPTVLATNTYQSQDGAGGFNIRVWQQSPLVAQFRQRWKPKGEIYFSNAPDALHLLADVAAGMSPMKREYNSAITTGVTADNLFDRHPGLDGALLVWFDGMSRDFLFTPPELGAMGYLQTVTRVSDGTIYRIERSGKRGEDAPRPRP